LAQNKIKITETSGVLYFVCSTSSAGRYSTPAKTVPLSPRLKCFEKKKIHMDWAL
jgi:hypothetical protein